MSSQANNADFSVELKSNKQLSSLSAFNEAQGGVLIEGTVGKLLYAEFVEPEILEVKGELGVLRLNITRDSITAKLGQAVHARRLKNKIVQK